jgi:hypothetical protein
MNVEGHWHAEKILGRSSCDGCIRPQPLLTCSVEGKTPYQAWHGKKPSMHHLWVLDCIAYMKITRPHLAKMDDRGLKTVFIGYEPGSKAYHLYNLADGQVHFSRDAIFDEIMF